MRPAARNKNQPNGMTNSGQSGQKPGNLTKKGPATNSAKSPARRSPKSPGTGIGGGT